MEKTKGQKSPPKKFRIILFFLVILIPAIWLLFINKSSDFDQASDKLTGSWLRSDGTYSIRISNVIKDGKMTAAYFNPKPIHVAKTMWTMEDDILEVYVEMDDVNYKGSNYKLTYNEQTGQLIGFYYQAGTQQTFEVTFSRLN